jgi:hypothetical protein
MILSIALATAIHFMSVAQTPQRFEAIEWADIWLPHSNESKLPRVLLIGDSITKAYDPVVEKNLDGEAYVGRLTSSTYVGDPMFTAEVALVLSNMKFDVIHFNSGIHGGAHPPEEYGKALQALVQQLHQLAPNATLIWAQTTPTRDSPSDGRPQNPRISLRNQTAQQIMSQAGITIDDLNAPMTGHPEYHSDNYHFKPEAVDIQAAQVAAAIKKALQSH